MVHDDDASQPDGLDDAFTEGQRLMLGILDKAGGPAAELLASLMTLAEPHAGKHADGLRVLVALLVSGQPRASACRAALGVSRQRLEQICKAKPDVARLVDVAEAFGLGRFEDELHRRALAGSSDRGSMRALEMVLKRHHPEYRERASIELTARVLADQATDSFLADAPITELLGEATEDA